MKTSRAAVLLDVGRPLEVIELQVPQLAGGQVLVEVVYSGICRSQLHEVRGHRGPDAFLPHTLGHEGAGIVRAVGPGVSKVGPDDHVVLSWIKGAGADVARTTYSSRHGAVNSGAISTFLDLAIVSENRVTPIPLELPLRVAALLGCAIPTGAGIVLNTLNVSAGESISVFGTGGVGLSAIIGAVLREAYPIIAVDISAQKLALARRAGATHTIDALAGDATAMIRELTAGRGTDYAIEAAGRAETMQAALTAVRSGGGVCVIAGNLKYAERFGIDPMDLIRGKQLRGTWGGESLPDRDIPWFANLLLAGKLDLDWLITDEYELTEVNRALSDLEFGAVGRAVLTFGHDG